jgi:hypothetical protein
MIGSRHVLRLLALATLAAACSDSTGPDGNDDPGETESFEWSGQIAPGRTVEIKGIGGDIRAVPATDGRVRVKALKRGDRDDPSSVRIEVVKHEDGVTICAVYPDVPGLPANECLPGLFQGQLSSRDNDVQVTFDVQVPAGYDFAGRTIGGKVTADDLDGDVSASTMAGDIDISTSGLAAATTMQGNVTASIGLTNWDRDLLFSSMDGNISVRIPAGTNAEVLGIARGSISTNFPLRITSQGSFRHVVGTLGSGGRRLSLSTSDGNIVLRSK